MGESLEGLVVFFDFEGNAAGHVVEVVEGFGAVASGAGDGVDGAFATVGIKGDVLYWFYDGFDLSAVFPVFNFLDVGKGGGAE